MTDAVTSKPVGGAGELRRLLGVVRRRWIYIVVPALTIAAVAFAVSVTATPTYQATAMIQLEDLDELLRGTVDETRLDQLEIATELQVIQSEAVAERVADAVSFETSTRELLRSVTARPIGNARLIQIVALDADPERAATIADGFAQQYVERRREALEARLARFREQLAAQIATLEQRLAALEAGPDPDAANPQAEGIAKEIAAVTARLAALPSDDTVLEDSGRLVRTAEAPSAPTNGGVATRTVLGFALGLLLGFGIALVREWLDDRVRDETDVAEATGGRPVLGSIPEWPGAPEASPPIATVAAPDSPTSEAVRRLLATLRGMDAAGTVRSLLVTAPGAGEGATTVAVNLAVAAARVGERVTLLDGDLRRRTASSWLGLADADGLHEVLAGSRTLADVLTDVSTVGIGAVPAGTAAGPEAADVIGSARLGEVVGELARSTDLVVADAPPAVAVADAVQIARHVDAVLVVAVAGMTASPALREAIETLARTPARVVGVVMNRASVHTWATSVYDMYDDSARTTGALRSGLDRRGVRP